MTWFSSATTRDQVLSIQPGYKAQFDALYRQLWSLPQIPAEVLELCRLRLAQLHQSETEWQRDEVALARDKRAALPSWHNSPQFSAAERACLGFAEVYAMDPQSITDAQADAVKEHFGDAGLVALIEALGIFFALTRLSLLWQLGPEQGAEEGRP